MRHPRFVVYQDKQKKWRWKLVAKNGRQVATSGEWFARNKAGAIRAVWTAVDTMIEAEQEDIEGA